MWVVLPCYTLLFLRLAVTIQVVDFVYMLSIKISRALSIAVGIYLRMIVLPPLAAPRRTTSCQTSVPIAFRGCPAVSRYPRIICCVCKSAMIQGGWRGGTRSRAPTGATSSSPHGQLGAYQLRIKYMFAAGMEAGGFYTLREWFYSTCS